MTLPVFRILTAKKDQLSRNKKGNPVGVFGLHQIKLQNLSVENGKLDVMMIKEIRKRVYLKADQEERLALIKDDMGVLRPSLFANVPPFLRFVPPYSLRGRGAKGRILPEGMEKMGWYDVFSCQTYNHQCIGCFF